MLIEFKVANFRSIREEQKFSLVASNTDKNLPSCVIDRELPGLSGVRFLKGAAIYGANASGKSNVLAAIRYVAGFVVRSATRIQPGGKTGAQPFKLDRESAAKPSEFEITFVADGVRFVFGFAVTPQRVVEEYLVAYPKGVPQRWYQRTFKASKGTYEWAKPSTAFSQDKSLQDKTRENSLFLSVGPQFNHAQLTQVFNWFNDGLHFIHLGAERRMGHGLHHGFTAEQIKNPAQHDRIINLLRSAEFGVVDVDAKEKEITFEEMKQMVPPALSAKLEKEHGLEPFRGLEINLTHKAEGIEPVTLDFDEEESDGTRRFFALIGPWLDILDNGYTVFVDEIETSLHPILVKELLKLLFCSKNNPKGAQIVFTTHNPVFLDSTLIRRDQVWFTEKSLGGETHLYPLSDYQPRKDEALAKGYLAGRYGAVPFLQEGLKI
ncbi:MAG: ATP-binding protein [Verrucomicrobiota bacterium]|jgi:predicted ATPase